MMRLRPRPDAPGPVPELVAAAFDLTVDLGGAPVLRGVDLDVRSGEVLTLVGPNGAGKSTLLAALSGDVAPGGGGVELWGRPIGEWRPGQMARRRSILPQAHRVSFPFTVAEVVAMGRAPWNGSAAADADEDRVSTAMKQTEVDEFAARPFTSLSGGEQARAMLARVIAQDTGLVLLDEPTAALDLRHQELVGRTCRDLAERGRAVVVVLHDLDLAAAYADRCALMSRGRVAAVGEPAEVFDADLLGEVYRQPVKVDTDPDTGAPRVTPVRSVGR